MSKKWAYCFAVLFILILRFGIMNTPLDEQLIALHYDKLAHVITLLKAAPIFTEFVGSWAMPVFVVTVILFWLTSQEDEAIPMQFLILPIAFIPFSIIGAILTNAEFRFNYFWIHPLIILPFGYFYVSMWTILIWILEKLRILR